MNSDSHRTECRRRQSTGHYRASQKNGKKVKKIPVYSAIYSDDFVTISVGRFKASKAAQVTITGLTGAEGADIPSITTGL